MLMLKSLGKLMELGVRQVIAGALYLAPLAAIGAASFFLMTSQHDLNYLLTVKPPTFWIGAFVAAFLGIGGLLIIGWLYIRWIFSVPLCMLEGDKPAVAMRKSRTRVAGKFRQIAVIIWGWGLLILADQSIPAPRRKLLWTAALTALVITAISSYFIIENIVGIIQDHRFESQCVVSSLNYAGLQKARDLNPDLKIGYIIAKSIGNMFRADIDFLSPASNMVTADVVAAANMLKR
jgi:hypothetical protein